MEWWEVIWKTLIEMEPVTICAIINAVAIVALVIITWRYARHTKRLVDEARLARRDDPELIVYLRETTDEDLRIRDITSIDDTFVAFTALLINPGLVPIAIEDVTEESKEEKGNKLVSKTAEEFTFALPANIQAEQISIYAFSLPWIIPSDGFTIWSRYLRVDKKDSKCLISIKFDYSVGNKQKSKMVGPISLTPRERHVRIV